MNIIDPLIGQQMGDYQIIAILGRGGMARVYRGYDARLERYAAVKVIDTQLITSVDENEYRQRFRREARAIANMRHPNIVDVYQFGEFGSLYYMAMVFIEGRDLGQILREHAQNKTRMTYGQVMRIARDMAKALDYAHGQGVIHRDIKPSNIMVTPGGHGVLTDFGLALSVPEGSLGNTFGSAHYIAPEQAIASNNAVPQSDLYSLCVVVYQMLAGKVPFDDPSAMSVVLKHLRDPVPPPSLYNPALGADVEQALFKGLQKEPSRRYANGAAMIEALEAALRRQKIDLTYSETPVPLDVRALYPKPALIVASGPSATIPLPPDMRPPSPQPASMLMPDESTVTPPPPAVVAAPVPASAETKSEPPAQVAPRGWTTWAAAAGLLLTVVVAVILLTKNNDGTIGSGAAGRTPASTQTPVIIAGALATEVPAVEATSTRRPAITPTRTQSAAPADAPTPAATRRPNRTPADANTSSAAASLVPAQQPATSVALATGSFEVRLIYDALALSLINISNQTLDLNGVEFAQSLPDGERRFRANLWSSAGFSVNSLPPGDCMQVWVDSFSQFAPPAACGTRQSWRSVASPRWFWISDGTAEAFSVERGSAILATCAIQDGTCEFSLGE